MIDGDEGASKALAAALREKGYVVDTCREAVPGFRMAVEAPPDCLVINAELPDIDGVWVARKVRTEPGPLSKVPILFLGDAADSTVRLRTLNVGGDAFVPLPTAHDDVIAQVGALIAMSRRLDTSKVEGGPLSISVGAAIKGDLSQFPIASLLMMFEMERRSGLIDVVSASGTRASLTLSSGLFCSTEVSGAPRPALEVLREVLSWRAGRFAFHARESAALPSPRASIGALVLEAMRLEDEANSPIPELDADDLIEADSHKGDNLVNDTERPPADFI